MAVSPSSLGALSTKAAAAAAGASDHRPTHFLTGSNNAASRAALPPLRQMRLLCSEGQSGSLHSPLQGGLQAFHSTAQTLSTRPAHEASRGWRENGHCCSSGLWGGCELEQRSFQFQIHHRLKGAVECLRGGEIKKCSLEAAEQNAIFFFNRPAPETPLPSLWKGLASTGPPSLPFPGGPRRFGFRDASQRRVGKGWTRGQEAGAPWLTGARRANE